MMSINRLKSLGEYGNIKVSVERVWGVDEEGNAITESFEIELNPYLLHREDFIVFRERLSRDLNSQERYRLIRNFIIAESLVSGFLLISDEPLERAEEIEEFLNHGELEKCCNLITMAGNPDKYANGKPSKFYKDTESSKIISFRMEHGDNGFPQNRTYH